MSTEAHHDHRNTSMTEAAISRPSVSESVQHLPDGSFSLSDRGRGWIGQAVAGGYPPELLAEFVSLLIGYAGIGGEREGLLAYDSAVKRSAAGGPALVPLQSVPPPPSQRAPRNLIINESSQRVVGLGRE